MKIISPIYFSGRPVLAEGVEGVAKHATHPRVSAPGELERLHDEIEALRDFVVALAATDPARVAQVAKSLGYTVIEEDNHD